MYFAILDDNQMFVNKITNVLKRGFADCEIKGFQNVNALLKSNELFDILFLEIGVLGADEDSFADTHIHRFPYIIYVTSHVGYIYNAFGINVVGFITKDNRLEEKIIEKVSMVKHYLSKEQIMLLKAKEGLIRLKTSEIPCFYFENSSVYVQTLSRKYQLTITSLHKLSKRLDESFFLINRNTIININHIQCFFKNQHKVLLVDNLAFQVSERKWKLLLNEYNRVQAI